MLKVEQATLERMESQYSGIVKTILYFEEAVLPSCPHCGAANTASVQAGIIGRTIYIASATTKVHPVPNVTAEIGHYFCSECKKYSEQVFDVLPRCRRWWEIKFEVVIIRM